MPALDARIEDLKPDDEITLSISIDISPTEMDRSCLSPGCTKTDRVWINRGRVKAVTAENRHIDLFAATRIYFVGIAAWSNIHGNEHSSLELNRSNVADTDAGIS